MSYPTRYLYYPGCSMEATGRAYDISARALMQRLGVELVELEDWNCCGATAYFAVRELESFAIAARNLAMATDQGDEDLCVVCNACYTTLAKTNRYMATSEEVFAQVNGALGTVGRRYDGHKPVRHLMDILTNDIGLETIAAKVRQPLGGLRVASYYGCQFSRPMGAFDSNENPTTLDDLFAALGAEPVRDFPAKLRCCGGTMMMTSPDVGRHLCHEILKEAADLRADVIVAACPLCEMNLEAYQTSINKALGTRHDIPVMFFTQLAGLALGAHPKELGLDMQLVSTARVARVLIAQQTASVAGGAR
jgi:heterodisulfide reductase subunit B